MASKIGTGSRSCTVTQGWIYAQTGGSAGGSIPVNNYSASCSISQIWDWDGDAWRPRTPTATQSQTFYNDGTYSGWLNYVAGSVSGNTAPPTGNGTFLGQTSTKTGTGSALFSGTATKGDTRTYGWTTNGSQTNDAPSSIFYDDGTYYGNIPLVSLSGAPSAPSGSGTVGQTTSTNTNGTSTANYSGNVFTDTTAPTINSFTASFTGATLNLSWSATDDRSWGNPAYKIYISDKNQSFNYLKSNFTSSTTSTSYTTDGQSVLFQNGYFYNIVLEAYDGAGNKATSTKTVQYVKTPPVAPNTPTFSSITDNSVVASWNAVTNGDAYKVEYKRSVDSTWLLNGTVTSTSSNIFGLSFSTTYNVRITSLRNDDAGGYITGGTSSTGSFTTTAPPDTIPPELQILSTDGNGRMKIDWTATDTGVGMRAGSPYEVFVNSGGATALVSKGFTTGVTWTFPKDGSGADFVDQVTYRMQVIAYDANNNSIAMYRDVKYVYVDNVPPTVSITSSNSVDTMQVNWTASDNIALKPTGAYELYISGVGGGVTTFKTALNIGTNSYTFTSDGNGQPFVHNGIYDIDVEAVDTSNNGQIATKRVTYTKSAPTVVSGFSSTASTSTTITLGWTVNATANAYKLEYKLSTDGSYTVLTLLGGSTNTYKITGLTANKLYDIRISAKKSTGNPPPNDYIDGTSTSIQVSTGAKPSSFAWTTAKVAGGNFNLTATEWNGFTTKINSFRVWKDLTTTTFTQAVAGNQLTASMFNQAVSSINAMSPPTSPPSTRVTGDAMMASYFNLLRDSLNSVT